MATTTPIYGFDVPTSTDYVKDGATAIETLGDDVDAFLGTAFNSKLHPGLVLVKSQTISSGVSSVSVTDAFSATYDAYKIVLSGVSASSAVSLSMTIGGAATNYYTSSTSGGDYTSATGTLTYSNQNAASSATMNCIAGNGTSGTTGSTIEIQNPFAATSTTFQMSGSDPRTTGAGLRYGAGYHSTATSYTSFQVIVSGPTLSGGRITVYGYAKD